MIATTVIGARASALATQRARIDTFLQNCLSKETLEQVSPKHLYDRFLRYMAVLKKQSLGELIDVTQLMSAVKADAVRYQRIADATDTTRFDAFLRRLAVLDVTVFEPLLLSIMGRPNITNADLDDVAVVLESYFVRRTICGMQTRGAGSMALALVKAVAQIPEGAGVAASLEKYLLTATGADQWPNDTVFQLDWRTRRIYGGLKRERVNMVLQAIEEAYQKSASSKAEPLLTFDFSHLEIEHIMPQKWREHWPLADGWTADGRDIVVHGIGNLTLVSKKLNPTLSNAPWISENGGKSKREALEEHSKLELNRWLLKHNGAWDKTSIATRADELFNQAMILWPIPSKPASNTSTSDTGTTPPRRQR
nr:HNH endonuclease family protein [Paraburkholderia sp. BL8N3]